MISASCGTMLKTDSPVEDGSDAIGSVSPAYDDVGTGDDALVLVHGHPFDRTMWRPQINAVTCAGWRAIAPDLRGYGRSPITRGKVTLRVFAADIITLLDELGLERVALCGLSMGGQIVMEFCRRFPNRVRGVVLSATSPRAETEQGKRNRYLLADRLEAEGMEQYAFELLPKMLAPETIATRPAIARTVLTMMRRAPAEGAAAALRGRAERPPYARTLARLHAPALIVVGDQDAFTSRAETEEMQRLLPCPKLVWMKGVGHMPNLEAEATFNAELLEFLDAIRGHSRPVPQPPKRNLQNDVDFRKPRSSF